MKKYLGVKVIEAEPMSEAAFINQVKNEDVPSSCLNRDGYKVVYEDGYTSWSPKEVFEKAYRKEKNLTELKLLSFPHQQRVQEEAQELSVKIHKLGDFISTNETFNELPKEEQERLKQQLMTMKYYLTILVERIENF